MAEFTPLIVTETEALAENPVEGIVVNVDPNFSRYFHITIAGPVSSPYEGGIFGLDLYITDDYPMVPPKVRFTTKIDHPNVDKLGRISLDILKANWVPTMQIMSVLLRILDSLQSPNPDGPFDDSVAQHWITDKQGASDKAREWTLQYANSQIQIPRILPELESILAFGVQHWYQNENDFIISLDFAKADLGLIPFKTSRQEKYSKMEKGTYNCIKSEGVVVGNSIIGWQLKIQWIAQRTTFQIKPQITEWSQWTDLLPIRTYNKYFERKWLPWFQIDQKWVSLEFPQGKIGKVHIFQLYICDEVNNSSLGFPISGEGLDQEGSYSLAGYANLEQDIIEITMQKTWTDSGKTANIKLKQIDRFDWVLVGTVKFQQSCKFFIQPIKSLNDMYSQLAIDTALAMDRKLQETKEITPNHPQIDYLAQYSFLDCNKWHITRSQKIHRVCLYFYGTIETDIIGVIGFNSELGESIILGEINLSTQKMTLQEQHMNMQAKWIIEEENFQGKCDGKEYDGKVCDGNECIIAPAFNKYENYQLWDVLKNHQVQVSKSNMIILRATFEGKKVGAKVYTVPNEKTGKSIIKQEAHFQHLFKYSHSVNIYEALMLQSSIGPRVVLIMDWYKNGSMSHQIKLRAAINKKFTEEEVLTILHRILTMLCVLKDNNIWHRDIKPDNILVNDVGLPDLMDYGEAIQQPSNQPSNLAGTSKYMSYKLKTTLKQWKQNNPLPTVDHDLEKSDLMSVALTVIALCRLREDAILNDLDTCEAAQKIVWQELHQHYSQELIDLLQRMMKYDELFRQRFIWAKLRVDHLLWKVTGKKTGLASISVAPVADQSSNNDYEDWESETFCRSGFSDNYHQGSNTCNIFVESLSNCKITGSMNQEFDSDSDEDPMEEPKLVKKRRVN